MPVKKENNKRGPGRPREKDILPPALTAKNSETTKPVAPLQKNGVYKVINLDLLEVSFLSWLGKGDVEAGLKKAMEIIILSDRSTIDKVRDS